MTDTKPLDPREEDKPITLRICRLQSGLWGGRLTIGEDELGELGAFPSMRELEDAAGETGLYPDYIEIETNARRLLPCIIPTLMRSRT